MNPADHIKAAEDYLDLIETAILKTGRATVPTSVLADAGLLHAHLAVAKTVEQSRQPKPNGNSEFRGADHHRQHAGRR